MEFQLSTLPIDTIVIVLVLLSGLFQKKYLQTVNVNSALKTLLVSALFTIVYAALVTLSGSYDKSMPVKWFFSYVTATSLYELFLKKLLLKFFPDLSAKKTAKTLILLCLILPVTAQCQSHKLTFEQQQFLEGVMPFTYAIMAIFCACIALLIIGICYIRECNKDFKKIKH